MALKNPRCLRIGCILQPCVGLLSPRNLLKMNVFELRNQLIADYDSYIRSFIRIRNKAIFEYVQQSLDEELLWPDPLIQLNPAFEKGATLEELITKSVLHQECQHIFCKKTETGKVERLLSLHRHQSEAIEI